MALVRPTHRRGSHGPPSVVCVKRASLARLYWKRLLTCPFDRRTLSEWLAVAVHTFRWTESFPSSFPRLDRAATLPPPNRHRVADELPREHTGGAVAAAAGADADVTGSRGASSNDGGGGAGDGGGRCLRLRDDAAGGRSIFGAVVASVSASVSARRLENLFFGSGGGGGGEGARSDPASAASTTGVDSAVDGAAAAADATGKVPEARARRKSRRSATLPASGSTAVSPRAGGVSSVACGLFEELIPLGLSAVIEESKREKGCVASFSSLPETSAVRTPNAAAGSELPRETSPGGDEVAVQEKTPCHRRETKEAALDATPSSLDGASDVAGRCSASEDAVAPAEDETIGGVAGRSRRQETGADGDRDGVEVPRDVPRQRTEDGGGGGGGHGGDGSASMKDSPSPQVLACVRVCVSCFVGLSWLSTPVPTIRCLHLCKMRPYPVDSTHHSPLVNSLP